MIITDKRYNKQPTSIRAYDIPLGTVFSGSILKESIYYRFFDGIVDLKDPLTSWDVSSTSSPNVLNYVVLNADLIVY